MTTAAMAFTIVEYVRPDNANPFRRWFDSLPPQAAAKVAAAIARLEMGNTSNAKRAGAITEYRINWGPGYRIYFAIEGNNRIILLGGGTKGSQRADIRRALALFEEYKACKADM